MRELQENAISSPDGEAQELWSEAGLRCELALGARRERDTGEQATKTFQGILSGFLVEGRLLDGALIDRILARLGDGDAGGDDSAAKFFWAVLHGLRGIGQLVREDKKVRDRQRIVCDRLLESMKPLQLSSHPQLRVLRCLLEADREIRSRGAAQGQGTMCGTPSVFHAWSLERAQGAPTQGPPWAPLDSRVLALAAQAAVWPGGTRALVQAMEGAGRERPPTSFHAARLCMRLRQAAAFTAESGRPHPAVNSTRSRGTP